LLLLRWGETVSLWNWLVIFVVVELGL
jgi:hypothetical protein